jgi:replicative DNA helicase
MSSSKEAMVLASVLEKKDVHIILGEKKEIFGAYGDVYEFLREYYLKYKAVPDVSLIEDRFGEIDFPKTMAASSAFYMEELRDNYVRARMEEIMLKAGSALDSRASSDVLQQLLTTLSKLGQHTYSVRDLSLIDIDSAAEHFEQLKEFTDANGGTPGIATGFDAIDSAYPTGMAPGHSIVLMGYTGRGKSMWSGLLAVNAWLQGKKVMVISLEMSPEEYRERIYAMMSEGMFKMSHLSRGEVDPDDFRTWATKKFKDAADFIVVSNQGNANVTPNTIQSKIDTHRPDVVILDYLQLMSDNAETQAMTPRMLNLSREIKLLAVNCGIPIVSITAVTDEDNDKRDSPPLLSQVAWSKGIEYDANLAIAVHRHDDTDVVEIAGRKNRHGPLFGCFFQVDFDSGLWVERFD